jgi:tripartite-type tricarboxylate transporter receptor subunit TctC
MFSPRATALLRRKARYHERRRSYRIEKQGGELASQDDAGVFDDGRIDDRTRHRSGVSFEAGPHHFAIRTRRRDGYAGTGALNASQPSAGHNVIVENRPGGNTVIGTEVAARAPADGHTLLVISPSYTVNPFVRKLSYDAVADFTGVTRLASIAMIIASHPSVPAKNIRELVSLARARPGLLTYATASVIGSQRIAGELFKDVARVDITHVPYNGGAPATLATVGGHTSLLVTNIIEVAPNVHAGKLRALDVL